MSVGLQFSRIETFRVRNHGNQLLRLYKISNDGDALSNLFTVHRGFYIAKNTDTTEGAADHILTLDIWYSQGLTEAMLDKAYMLDLLDPDTGDYRRFRMHTGGTPLIGDKRFIYGLHAAFNDTKAIV